MYTLYGLNKRGPDWWDLRGRRGGGGGVGHEKKNGLKGRPGLSLKYMKF